tara:strand:- start:292710 stop:295754 length:3045 start_codon:yes stop_codon:yes gene_type:complete
MNVTAWAQRHHRSILFFLIALGIGGAMSIRQMPVGLFPPTTFPRVVVSIESGDRPASRMEIEVTVPVEEALRAVPGIKRVRSTTSRGAAEVSVDFAWGEDMIAAMLQVESAVGRLSGSLPAGAKFEVRRMDPTVFPVIAYSVVSDTRSLVELRDLALFQIRPSLSSIDGVANIVVLGGQTAEYQAFIDPSQIEALGLTLDDVARALSGSNVVQAVGRIEDLHRLYLVLSDTQFQEFDSIKQTVIRMDHGGVVRLEDIAEVVQGTAPQWTRVTADGHDAVLFQVYQQPGGNTVQIAHQAEAKMVQLETVLPADVRITKWYDQSELIVASAMSVRDAIIIGIILAVVVLLLFLRNLRITLIAVISVPLVLTVVVLLLHSRGLGFNIMTLGGMAAAVALVIDDSLVMIEHILRRFHEESGTVRERVLVAASEFTRPLAGSSAATLIVFAPLAFLSGVTGAFFGALSITMATCLLVSFFIAWIAVPILAMHVLHIEDAEEPGGHDSLMSRGYQRLIGVLGHIRWLVPVMLAGVLLLGYVASKQVGQGFMPAMDEGGFILDYVAEPGTSLQDTDQMVRSIEDILQLVPEVDTYSRRTGLQLGGGLTEANSGDFFIKLIPQPRRHVEQIMDDIRVRVHDRVPGLEIEMPQLMEDLIGDLTAVPQPIEIKLFSDDETTLIATAEAIATAIGSDVPGVVDVKTGVVLAGDALVIRIDRDRAAIEGLSVDSITTELDAYLGGITPTQVQVGPKMVDIRVWTPEKLRDRASAIESLRIRTPSGALVPMSRIAHVETVSGQPQITREDLKRMIAVTGRISGRDMGSTVRDVISRLNKSDGLVPPGITWRLGGLYEQQRIAMQALLAVFVAAIVLVYTLLLFLYEDFRVAFMMMLTVGSAAGISLCGLWVTGTELNITAMMGLTMIVGIVTEVLIFYYSEYVGLGQEGPMLQRLILAGQNRARPIAMTTLAAILAMMPLALGLGEGAAMLKPMAIAIVFGLIAQFPLVIIAFPILLTIGAKNTSRH